jgi:type VI secretion system secreted protein VgrG
VIVEFLEGDPDHPIITGRVYNADNMPPMDLPENKHKSIIRDDYGNEIVFDGTPGDEHITLYSPHHGSTLEVGKSYCATTGTDAGELFAGAKTETIGGSRLYE